MIWGVLAGLALLALFALGAYGAARLIDGACDDAE